MPEFGAWLQQGTPEQSVPHLWAEEKPLSKIGIAMHQLLLIQVFEQSRSFIKWPTIRNKNLLINDCFQAFRPDRVIAAASILVSAVLGEDFMPSAEKELDFGECVEKELRANVPALLCSVPGYDASGRVDDLAAELNKQIASIAIGSAEGFNQADRAINMACKSGR